MSRDKLSVAERTGLIMFLVGPTQGVIPFPVHDVSTHDALLSIPGLIRSERAVAVRTVDLTWTQKVRELTRVLDIQAITASDIQYLEADEMATMAIAHLDVLSIDEFLKIRKYAGTSTSIEYGEMIDEPADDLDVMAGDADE